MKIGLPKKISIRTGTTLVLVAIILIEAYMVYSSLYKKLAPEPENTVSASVVRINRSSLSDITLFLGGLDNFQPPSVTLTNPNPFKYSP